MATSSDINLNQFIINTTSKSNYDQLSAAGRIQQNQLYLVTDAPIDAQGASIQNVGSPEQSSDAATKGYVDAHAPAGTWTTLSGEYDDGTAFSFDVWKRA